MSDDSIHIEYNQELKALEELLEGVERAGDFFANGVVEIPMPKVEVTGVGVLSFPVPPAQIASMTSQASRAPYGRGEETILDESVRKVWQLQPGKVRITGKSWAASFDTILRQVIVGLGCEGLAVSAEFYKMLVYEEGGFFLTHRDTEKAGGMFGTLVVVLPSAHRGGELVIRHAGREVVVDMSRAEVSEASFAAFYADCEHEVRAITEGSRVCLIYNLIQDRTRVEARPQRTKKSRSPRLGKPLQMVEGDPSALSAPDYEKQIAAAAELLERNLSASRAALKVAWLLEHQYSPGGLSFVGLKSADAARVKVLVQAAERAGCAVHLGIVHIEESGAAEEYYDPDSRSVWGRHRYCDEKEYAGSDDFEVIEVSDWRHYVNQWRDLSDQSVEFGEIPLEPGELLPMGALDGEKPDRQRLMEASGNEGASFERSYHRAALVIWRRERYASVLLQAGVTAALPYLQERIEECAEKKASSIARKGVVALARQLVSAWRKTPEYPAYPEPARPEKRDGMLRLLTKLGDASVLEQFIAEVVTRDYDGSDNASLVDSVRLLGPEKTAALLSELMRRHTRRLHGACMELISSMARALPERGCVKGGDAALRSREWQGALRQIAEVAVGRLDEVGEKQSDNEWSRRMTEEPCPVNAALVTNLMEVLASLKASALRLAAVEKFAARPAVFDPVTVLVPALGSLKTWDAATTRLWEHSVEFLLRRSGLPPEAPRDWRQDVKMAGRHCADCRELQAFTLDPVERTHRFRVKKERRQHLHQQIDLYRLDMTHVTDRNGSPQTLVCTKDRRSYQRLCERYRKDISALDALAGLAGRLSAGGEELGKRIAEVCARARQWSPANT